MNKTHHVVILTVMVMLPAISITGCYPGLIRDVFESRTDQYENRCKLTLRALGSTQLAYSDGNLNHDYGTWEELTKADYIQEGYTTKNIIDNYNIPLFACEKSVLDEEGKIIKESTFTIVAVPISAKNKLRTFAIGDDQIPRVWAGQSEKFNLAEINLHDASLWEPAGPRPPLHR